ncbi:MAG TPA: DUF4229 domain-containing protein [Micromonospora sp.]|jgi:hypothetical protein
MSPAVKYTLGRIGLFVVVLALLWPVDLDIFVKLMLAVLVSAGLAFFLLRRWRDEMAYQLAAAAERRRAEKDRLRAALAGDEQVAEEPSGGPTARDSDGGSEEIDPRR